ncbi:hypothetical protein [Raoultibacter phocaeensis]|uniref:hypothetical protein n=1 Tax=Raoultibacter phocaeensis TaxID=2479841 RepID=UPI0011194EBC|nr:hypothetical protein [Raoultibacter phocaeensis]
MNNFEARYSVVGTSALKADVSGMHDRAAIIEFPMREASHGSHAATQVHRFSQKLHDSEFATEVRTGTVQGKAFGRIAPWQSVSAGLALAVAAFATIFFGV